MHPLQATAGVDLQHASIGIKVTKWIHPVKVIVGSAVPEGSIEEDRIDRCRSITASHLADICSVYVENLVIISTHEDLINGTAWDDALELRFSNSGRAMHFQRVKNHGISAVDKSRFASGHQRICEAVERIIFGTHLSIHATKSGKSFSCQSVTEVRLMTKLTARSTGVQGVLCADVCTGMPVAGRTGRAAV